MEDNESLALFCRGIILTDISFKTLKHGDVLILMPRILTCQSSDKKDIYQLADEFMIEKDWMVTLITKISYENIAVRDAIFNYPKNDDLKILMADANFLKRIYDMILMEGKGGYEMNQRLFRTIEQENLATKLAELGLSESEINNALSSIKFVFN